MPRLFGCSRTDLGDIYPFVSQRKKRLGVWEFVATFAALVILVLPVGLPGDPEWHPEQPGTPPQTFGELVPVWHL